MAPVEFDAEQTEALRFVLGLLESHARRLSARAFDASSPAVASREHHLAGECFRATRLLDRLVGDGRGD